MVTSGKKEKDFSDWNVQALLVEDDEADYLLVKEYLQLQKDATFTLTRVPSVKDAEDALKKKSFDVILLDLSLPDCPHYDAFTKIRSKTSHLPVVILSGLDDQKVALESVRQGAQDFLVKGHFDEKLLSRVIRYAIERKEFEEEVLKATERYETVFQLSAAAITVADAEEHLVSWNPSAEKLLGMNRDDLYLKPVSELYPEREWKRIKSLDLRNKGPQHQVEARMLTKTGHEVDVELSLTILKDSRQNVYGSIAVILDITRLKQLEQLKDDFVSMVSHELRTPLFVIREGMALLEDETLGPVNKEQKDFLQTNLRNIDRLGRLINDLLDISKIESQRLELRRQKADLVGLVRSVMNNFAKRVKNKKIELKSDFSSKAIEVYMDSDRIIQVFTNLIGNALKFTEKGNIKITVTDHADRVECQVEDTGCGIASKDLPKVFEKFQQLHKKDIQEDKGTGLGLAISKAIVELHGGTISVASEKDKGTRFTFTIPKVTSLDLFREYVQNDVKNAAKFGTHLAVIVFNVTNYGDLKKRWGPEACEKMMEGASRRMRQELRRAADLSMMHEDLLLVMVAINDKSNAAGIATRLEQTLIDYMRNGHSEKTIQLTKKTACFPEDGRDIDRLLTEAGIS